MSYSKTRITHCYILKNKLNGKVVQPVGNLCVFNFLPIVEQNKLIILRKLILKIICKFNEKFEINFNKEKFRIKE